MFGLKFEVVCFSRQVQGADWRYNRKLVYALKNGWRARDVRCNKRLEREEKERNKDREYLRTTDAIEHTWGIGAHARSDHDNTQYTINTYLV